MSRPRQYAERISTAIRLDVDLHDRLMAAAKERDVSANLLVSRAVAAFLDQLIPVEEMQGVKLPMSDPRPLAVRRLNGNCAIPRLAP